MSDSLYVLKAIKKPYVLLHHPVTGKAAVYSRQHRLIASESTQELLRFAQTRNTKVEEWSSAKDAHFQRELPAWADRREDLNGGVMYWLHDSKSDVVHMRLLPDA